MQVVSEIAKYYPVVKWEISASLTILWGLWHKLIPVLYFSVITSISYLCLN